ncbi:MAG: hypothetical protein H6540_07285 [Bacteroidales bacterium]|nr:hypothetical protein [Bacteroidales bacterium]
MFCISAMNSTILKLKQGINCLDNGVLHIIDWKIEAGKEIISAKDMNQPSLKKADHNLCSLKTKHSNQKKNIAEKFWYAAPMVS